MPLLRRRLLSLLALAALAGGLAAAPAHAQSAGDDQYSDPFGSSGQGSGSSKPKPKPSTSQTQAQAPATGTGSGSAPAATAPATATAAADPAAASQLPRTGTDARPVALAGLVLLLLGLALRRRTAPARR